MTGFSKQDISYAVELVHLISEYRPDDVAASAEVAEVGAWVEDAVRSGQVIALTSFLEGCGPAGSETYAIARGLLRSVGSIFRVDGETRMLFGIPFVAEADVETDAPLRAIECRQPIERELEAAKGLPFLSIRMCAHPTRRVELDAMGPLELENVGRDLVRYSASKRLNAPTLGPGAENLVWLGVFRVSGDDASPLFGIPKGAALQHWRSKARDMIQGELKQASVSYVDLMFPMRVQEALTASRLFQLRTELNTARVTTGANHMVFQRKAAHLSWTLRNDETGDFAKSDMWLPDEREESVLSCLRSFAKRNEMELVQG